MNQGDDEGPGRAYPWLRELELGPRLAERLAGSLLLYVRRARPPPPESTAVADLHSTSPEHLLKLRPWRSIALSQSSPRRT